MKNKLKIDTNSFRFKIAFYYLVASLSVILIFSCVIYTVVSYIIVKETVSKTEMALKSSSENIGELLRFKKSLLQLYSYDPTLQALSNGETQLQENVVKQLTTLAQSDVNILGVFVSLNDGFSLSSTHLPISSRSSTLSTQLPCITDERTGDYQHSDDWTITLAVPIKDESDTQLGLLGVDLDYCIFSHTLETLNLGGTDLIYIKDGKDDIIFRSDKISMSTENTKTVFSNTPQNGYDSKSNTLVYSILVPNTDWTMIGVVTPDGLDILKRQLFDIVIFSTLLLSFALLVISVIVSRNLTDPISRLADGMEDIQDLAILSIRNDEISETAVLTQSYNRMIEKIKTLMHELEQKQEELRGAEFDALTSQINPHFLYNTLDTIVWLAEFKDTDKIIKVTKSLASFFRLSLNGGRSIVTLGDEMEHVKQYLIIQKERYGDKFDYSFEVEENTLDFLMPKILLQPIVENAIYHGIKPMDSNGFITIKAYMHESNLILTITDDGVGFDTFSPSGVGIKNVKKRIQLFYGASSELTIQSLGKGTRVTLTLHDTSIKQLHDS
ncbi:MAG: cache domain-containing sensor histidine kinase [Lachnospiraceae bacterium]